MFRVRHAHFPAPNASSTPSTPPSSYALLSTRQSASAFNQPLSLDTSSVTTMKWMFKVRSARAMPSWPLPCTLLCRPSAPQVFTSHDLPSLAARIYPARCLRRRPQRLPISKPIFRSLYALLSTRQKASAFNQPLSFDMSSVTNTDEMFLVRSAPVPCAQLSMEP